MATKIYMKIKNKLSRITKNKFEEEQGQRMTQTAIITYSKARVIKSAILAKGWPYR